MNDPSFGHRIAWLSPICWVTITCRLTKVQGNFQPSEYLPTGVVAVLFYICEWMVRIRVIWELLLITTLPWMDMVLSRFKIYVFLLGMRLVNKYFITADMIGRVFSTSTTDILRWPLEETFVLWSFLNIFQEGVQVEFEEWLWLNPIIFWQQSHVR